MEQLERLTVHMEEAIRLAALDDEPHQRLGLLLLDGAVELMMHRVCEDELRWHPVRARLLDYLRAAEASGQTLEPEQVTMKGDLEGEVLSATRLRKIEREFAEKAKWLSELGHVPSETARALAHLHRYRNEAHHRDIVRPQTLATAVRIYSYLACTMMRDLPGPLMFHLAAPTPTVARQLGNKQVGWQNPRSQVAASLLATVALDPDGALSTALSGHVLDRLAEIHETLEDAANFAAGANGLPWTPEALLHLMQLPDELALLSPEDLVQRDVPVTPPVMDQWGDRARAIADVSVPLTAFGFFADLEDEIEPIELRVIELSVSIDRAIQEEIDVRRGK